MTTSAKPESPSTSSGNAPPAVKTPVPVPQPESERYWEGLRRSEIWMRRCEDCKKAYFYPRDNCAHCFSRRTQWFRASGRGTIYTFAIAHRAPHPGFADKVPYVVAMVELDDGPRVPTNIVGVDPDPSKIKIGAAVMPVFEKLTDTITLLKFALA